MLRRLNGLSVLITCLLIIVSFTPALGTGSWEGDETISEGRGYQESHSDGGERLFDGRDDFAVEKMENMTMDNHQFVYSGCYEEDFESYISGQDIIGTGGWTYHQQFTTGNLTAETQLPFTKVTPTFGKHYCENDTTMSKVHSPSFDVRRGIFRMYFATSMILRYPSTITTTAMTLLGTSSNNSTSLDNMFLLGFYRGGISCYNGAWIDIAHNLDDDTWYRIEINFDCTISKADVSVYNRFGVSKGSRSGLNYQNPISSAKTLQIITSHRRDNEYITTYVDDISLLDFDAQFTATTENLSISDNMRWSSLYVNKGEYGKAKISVEIMDPMESEIVGFDFNGTRSTMPLTGLKSRGITSFKLRFTFHPSKTRFPRLNGYTLEWNSSRAWRDSFTTSLKIGYLSGIKDMNGRLVMAPWQVNGVYLSKEINLPPGCYWKQMMVNRTLGDDSYIMFDLIDASTGRGIPGFTDLQGAITDIFKVNPTNYPKIKVRIRMNSEGEVTPTVGSISVSWRPNNLPSITDLYTDGEVYRNGSAAVRFKVSDDDQASTSLFITIAYRHEMWESWEINHLTPITYNQDHERFELDFNPPNDAPVGFYDLKISATDSFGDSCETIITEYIEVKNNRPMPPNIELGPEFPRTYEDIEVVLLTKGEDIETEKLKYTYKFLLNGEEMEDYIFENLTIFETPSLPAEVTKKNDVIEVEVVSNDGLNYSEPFTASIGILNSPPELIDDFPGYIIIYEDTVDSESFNLHETVIDRDDDLLEFYMDESYYMYIEMDEETGAVEFAPFTNYHGEENLTFTADDGDVSVHFNLMVYILEVNDPPTGEIIGPTAGTRIVIGETLIFEAEIDDIDTPLEDISITWEKDGEQIGADLSINHTFTELGIYNISCYVNDGEADYPLGHLDIEVVKPDPPYSAGDVARSYNTSGIPVKYDMSDIFGNGIDPRNEDVPEINITGITSESLEDRVRITLHLEGPAAPSDSIEPGYGDGTWTQYSLYFVKESWSEPLFEQNTFNIYSSPLLNPPSSNIYLLKIGSGYLSSGMNGDFGSPEMSENDIIWTIDMKDMVAAGIQAGDYSLYASALILSSSGGAMTASFDTAGHGSQEHLVEVIEEEKEEDDDGSALWIIILIVILLLLAIGVAGYFLMKRKEAGGEEEEVKEGLDEETPVPAEQVEEQRPKLTGANLFAQQMKLRQEMLMKMEHDRFPNQAATHPMIEKQPENTADQGSTSTQPSQE